MLSGELRATSALTPGAKTSVRTEQAPEFVRTSEETCSFRSTSLHTHTSKTDRCERGCIHFTDSPADGCCLTTLKKTPWPYSASELYRQSGRRRSEKLVPTFADRGVSRGQRNGSPRPLISVFWTGTATFLIQVAPQLTSRG